MFLPDSNHLLCQSYLSKDKLNQYRRILESSPGLRKFSVQGCSGDSDSESYGWNGTSSSSSVNDDEFVVELSTLLFLYQGRGQRQTCGDNDALTATIKAVMVQMQQQQQQQPDRHQLLKSYDSNHSRFQKTHGGL